MTQLQKQEMITAIAATVEQFIGGDTNQAEKEEQTEMLTIHEAAQSVKGLSEHTVRQLAAQGKIPSIRTGAGKNGKILVPKAALLNYLNGNC